MQTSTLPVEVAWIFAEPASYSSIFSLVILNRQRLVRFTLMKKSCSFSIGQGDHKRLCTLVEERNMQILIYIFTDRNSTSNTVITFKVLNK